MSTTGSPSASWRPSPSMSVSTEDSVSGSGGRKVTTGMEPNVPGHADLGGLVVLGLLPRCARAEQDQGQHHGEPRREDARGPHGPGR